MHLFEYAASRRQYSTCCIGLVTLLATLPSSGNADSLSFDDALSRALHEAPTLAVNAAQIDAAKQAAIPAGKLPEPKLELGVDNLPIEGPDRYSLTQDFMTMRRIGLMQEFPNHAKREAQVAVAQAQVKVAEAQTRITQLTVLSDTATAWIARDTAERQLMYIDALLEQNRLLDQAVRAQLAAGKGMATDAVMVRQEAALIEERRDKLLAARDQAIAALRRWIGAAADIPLTGSAPNWSITQDTLAHGLHRHPELELFEPQARRLDAQIAEAQAGERPDWALELAYQKRGAEFSDMVMVQVSLDLPLFPESRLDPQVAARRAERTALDAEREATLREHAAMLEGDLAEYKRLSNAVQRQREALLPLSDEKVALATAAWRGNQGSLADVVTARLERIDTELKAIALEGERAQLAARLHYAYGESTGVTP
jgi:outer membrane protein TolC